MSVAGVPPVDERLCRSGAALAGVTALFLVASNAVMWLVPQWVGFGISTLHLCVLAWGLLSMRTLFRLLAHGEAFVAETGYLLRRFGISGDEMVVSLTGALILVFGSVMADATRIADENREII